MLRKFIKKNLEAAEKYGNEVQRVDMVGVVAVLSHHAGELSDFMGGVRRLNDHAHHTPKDLANALIDGVVTITQLRKEIGR